MTELNQSDYANTVADLVRNFLNSSIYAGYFKYFFYGNPEEGIPANECPCVVIIKEGSETTQGPTGMDFIKENIMVRVVVNKRSFVNGGPFDEVLTQRELENLCEGIDATTGQYSTESIKGVLRKNFTLGSQITNQTIAIEYGKVINPIIDEITRECQIKISAEYYVMTPGKQ